MRTIRPTPQKLAVTLAKGRGIIKVPAAGTYPSPEAGALTSATHATAKGLCGLPFLFFPGRLQFLYFYIYDLQSFYRRHRSKLLQTIFPPAVDPVIRKRLPITIPVKYLLITRIIRREYR